MTSPTNLYALDIETECAVSNCPGNCSHALYPRTARITCAAVANDHEEIFFDSFNALSAWLEARPDAKFIGHNFKFDITHLLQKGAPISLHQWVGDTCLMAYIHSHKPKAFLNWYERERRFINEELGEEVHRKAGANSLKVLAPFFLADVAPFWEVADKTNPDYVIKDARYTWRLHEYLSGNMTKPEKDFLPKLLSWTKLLAQMELTGVSLDKTLLIKLHQEEIKKFNETKKMLDEIFSLPIQKWENLRKEETLNAYKEKQKIYEEKHQSQDKIKIKAKYEKLAAKALAKLPPFSFDSPKQVKWLFDEMGFPAVNLDGEESTGIEVLNSLKEKHPEVEHLIKYRESQKLIGSFFEKYENLTEKEPILYPNFNPVRTRTGRLSSSGEFNIQQVPSQLHKLFIPRNGHKMIVFDLAAIEPRLIAYYSGDKKLCDLMMSGADFHGENARIFFDLSFDLKEVKTKSPLERDMAKEVGLSLFFGAITNRLQRTSEKYGFHWNREKAQNVFDTFKESYKEVFAFRDGQFVRDVRCGVRPVNLFGRPLDIEPEKIEMTAFNTLIQSSASDLVWNAATHWQNGNKGRGSVLMLIHDEVVAEVPTQYAQEEFNALKHCLENLVTLNTPHGRIPIIAEGGVFDAWEKP